MIVVSIYNELGYNNPIKHNKNNVKNGLIPVLPDIVNDNANDEI